MAVLYLTEQRSIVRKTGDRLRIEKDDKLLLEVPCLKLDAVLIFGNVQVTTQALVEMLDHGIELALLTMGGRLRGQLTPPAARNVRLRLAQYEVARDPAVALLLARAVVQAKIENSAAVLRRLRSNDPAALPLSEVTALEQAGESARQTGSLPALLGIEGSAARRYFDALGAFVPAALAFDGRNRRPPRDPVNALLSFGYVLAGNELQALLDGLGFDPYLGFYHQPDDGRPSLALDLLEEVRACLVDRWALGLLNRRMLTAEDFAGTAHDEVLLRPEALRKTVGLFEREMTASYAAGGGSWTFREVFRRQAERLRSALLGEGAYEAFRWPG